MDDAKFEYLGQMLCNHVITTSVNGNFDIPKADPENPNGEQFVIVWMYQSGQITADTYKWSAGRLIAWDGDEWEPVEYTCAYNPLVPDLNHRILAVITKY